MWIIFLTAMAQTLVYTGDTDGIGSGSYRVERLQRAVAAQNIEILEPRAHHGVAVRGGHALIAEDRTVEGLLRAFAAMPSCKNPTSASAMWTPAGAVFLDGVTVSDPAEMTVWECDGARLMGLTDVLPEEWTPEKWEVRLGLHARVGEAGSLDLVAKEPDEPARRFARLSQMVEQGSWFVDAGDFVDGASTVLDRSLSLHRALGFDMLRRLEPVALTPGPNELAAGPATFLVEAGDLPYVGTNWVSEAHPLPRSVLHENVGFLGVIDPKLTLEGVTLEDPREAVIREAASLREQGAEWIVLLTTQEMRWVDLPVDVVLGDPHRHVGRIDQMQVMLGEPGLLDRTAPVQFPLSGIATLSLEPDLLWMIPRRNLAVLEPDPMVQEAISRVRFATYPALDTPLIPELDDDDWPKLACEAVAETTRADVVWLPPLPDHASIPGPLTELMVMDRLGLLDELDVHHVPGAVLSRLLTKAYGVVPVSCGAPLGEKAPKVEGRPVDPARIYRLVTSSRPSEEVRTLLSEARSSRLLDRHGPLRVVDEEGPISLRRAVLEGLRSTEADELLARKPTDKNPLWLGRIDRLSFRAERFMGTDDEAYASMPETLANSPSSLTIGGDLDASLDYSSRTWNTSFRTQVSYARLVTNDDVQESADDLRVSVTGSLPGVKLAVGPLGVLPYGEFLLDSEITATEAEDGTLQPQQADSYLIMGMSSTAWRSLKRVRLGAFTFRDLAVIQKAQEFGARLDVSQRVSFGPALYWTNALDGYVYSSTPDQDASDLRFKILMNSRLNLPLSRSLTVALYGEAFVFAGRVPSTRRVAASWTTGGALDFSGVFAARRRAKRP